VIKVPDSLPCGKQTTEVLTTDQPVKPW